MKSVSIPHPAEALVLARVNPQVIERAREVRLMAFDIDGILTDGGLWYGENGELVKRFNSLDGYGLRMLRESGIAVAFITGRKGPIVARRAAELGIELVQQGVRDKVQALGAMASGLGCSLDQVGFMGDDIMDLAALQRVGFSASVPNAPAYIAQAVHWVASTNGGHGAARECCDLILAAQGRLGPFLLANSVILGDVTQ
ncbi:MAG: HAD hydrolase family protein [Alcaligenaceae bacterium]|jgi:3-deoxy-D-manno-octulosonate 8-phosphate phosphatase (KDO 8-P phosphatase)|nr:HAD hydrolase family protein [Alcaligenaceae bacterium]